MDLEPHPRWAIRARRVMARHSVVAFLSARLYLSSYMSFLFSVLFWWVDVTTMSRRYCSTSLLRMQTFTNFHHMIWSLQFRSRLTLALGSQSLATTRPSGRSNSSNKTMKMVPKTSLYPSLPSRATNISTSIWPIWIRSKSTVFTQSWARNNILQTICAQIRTLSSYRASSLDVKVTSL